MEANYRRARSMGIPLIRLPVNPQNLIWLMVKTPIWRLVDHLPVDWGSSGRYSRRGWYFRNKADTHLRLGPVWALVTPQDVYIHVADPNAIHDLLMRRGDFRRPSKMYGR